ncbi:MAG: DUF87 domain-containing protein [Lachnospiraceae bacterium]|nr:DUF87 domain-containing protein [Lachnospiraceae bacterium]
MKFKNYQELQNKKEDYSSFAVPAVAASKTSLPPKTSQLSYNEIPQGMNLSVLQQNLGNCLQIIDDEVMKGYRVHLSDLPIVPLDQDTKLSLKDIQFFRISELVYQENEFSVYALSTMFHALSNKPCTLVLMIKSNGLQNDFYLGVRSLDKRFSSGTMTQMLKQSLMGVFPGSRIDAYYDEDMRADMQKLHAGCISGVTCVADFKQKDDNIDNQEFMQGLEKFVDSMQGKAYTAVFIAENVGYEKLIDLKRDYENIYTQISPFANMQMNFSTSDSTSTAQGESDSKTQNLSYGVNQGTSVNISNADSYTEGNSESFGSTDTSGKNQSVAAGTSYTEGVTEGTQYTESDSHSTGTNVSIGVNASVSLAIVELGGNVSRGCFSSDAHSESRGTSHAVSKSDSISKTLTYGLSDSHADSVTHGTNQSRGKTQSYGMGTQHGETFSAGEAFSLVNSKTLTETFGSSQGITLNAKNMTLMSITQRLEKHLKRIEECESIGMWDFAAYFIGESAAETETAANTYQSVVSGLQSGIERAAVNTWFEEEKVESIFEYIKNFLHPCFLYEGFDYDEIRQEIVNPSVLVSTDELAIHMGLPRHSVNGLPVTEHTAFAQEVLKREEEQGRKFNLGKIYHLGKEAKTKVDLDVESLTKHTFITGATGSGKSNTVYEIISRLNGIHMGIHELPKAVPTLIIEPAKGEYKQVFGKDFHVFGTNPYYMELLRINPFQFEKGIHILEHIDRLIDIFNVCWPMYAAMPAVLKEAVEQAYCFAGWDLSTSQNRYTPAIYPCFADVLAALRKVISSSDYSQEVKDNYTGSLITRVKSLTNGLNGQIFTCNEVDQKQLFEESAIVDLSRVASSETKAMIMGILIMRLQERRMSQGGINLPLRHITILEEAHNLLKRTSMEQSSDSSNLLGKSVEMISNAIAEMRTYGEGFVIVDQAPGLLDMSVIRNTNTKIIMRLPEYSDRELTGKAAGLTDKQIDELAKLPSGVAAVYQDKWIEPVLCKVNYYNVLPEEYKRQQEIEKQPTENVLRGKILQYILSDISQEEPKTDVELLKAELLRSNMPSYLKIGIMKALKGTKPKSLKEVYGFVAECIEQIDDIFRNGRHAKNIEEWNQDLIAGLGLEEELSAACQYNILECLIYKKSCEKNNNESNFIRWMDYMGRRVV